MTTPTPAPTETLMPTPTETPTPTPTETPEPTPTPTETPIPTQTIIIREFSDPPPRLPVSGLKSFQRNVRNSRRRSI